MDLSLVKEDIELLEKALLCLQKTNNYFAFPKGKIMFDLCEAINMLKYKADKQNVFVNQPETTAS